MRRVLLLIVLTVGTLLPAGRAASADPVAASITVTGSRTSFVDVAFPEKFVLDERGSEIDSGGRFGGWMLHPLGGSPDKGEIAGAYTIDEVAPTDPAYGPTLFTVNTQPTTLPAGRYRVYLLADGPTEVRVPLLEGKFSKTIRPAKATGARWTAADIPLTAPGVVNDGVSQPLKVTRDSITFTTLYLYSEEGATVQNVFACLRDTDTEAPPTEQNCEGGGWLGYVLHPQQDYLFTLNSIYPPGSIDTGTYFAFAKARATKVERVMGVGVTVDFRL